MIDGIAEGFNAVYESEISKTNQDKKINFDKEIKNWRFESLI